MILGNEAIIKAFNSPTGWGFNNASVLEKKQVQPASVDLRLDSWFTCPVNKTVWNVREPFVLKPQGFILGRTLESLWLSQFLAAQVSTRSSAMRDGIDVCMSAGWVDPGYSGKITLEITNHTEVPFILNPLVVNDYGILQYENQSYCQIKFFPVMGCTEPYKGKYGGPQQDESDMISKGVEK